MADDLKKLLNECGCSDYDLCLKYLQECCPDLNIDCVTQDCYYFISENELLEMAKECLIEKVKKNE